MKAGRMIGMVTVALVFLLWLSLYGGMAQAGAPSYAADTARPLFASANSLESLPAGAGESILGQLARSQYQFRSQATSLSEVYSARNIAHGLELTFDGDGVKVLPTKSTSYNASPAWELGLRLVGYGYGEISEAAPVAQPLLNGDRIEYQRGDLSEWYVNNNRGLEQGFTLVRPPANGERGAQPLSIRLAIHSSLRLLLSEDSRSLVFLDDQGRDVLDYTGLRAWGADGTLLSTGMAMLNNYLQLMVDERDAIYPITIDPLLTQVAKLAASDSAAGDYFGYAVSISSNTIVVGAFGDNSSSGSAYVFGRNQGGADNWGEVKKLTASDGTTGDNFGYAVSISGDTLVVGAYRDDSSSGSAYVFGRNQGGADNWGQVTKLNASDGAAGDFFGYTVSISGDTIVAGASNDDDNGGNSGSAYVFGRNQGGADNWGQVVKLTASDGAENDYFGYAVSISGDTLVASADGDDDKGLNSGSAYVFGRNRGGADNWGEVKKLTASDGAAGDYFGDGLSISGATLVVGAHGHDDNGLDSGSAYVYGRNRGGADNWGEVKELTASDGAAGDHFGFATAISGDRLVVGAYGYNSFSGSAYVFGRNQGGDNNWGELQKLTDSDGAANDWFGDGVSISGNTLVVGVDGDDDNGVNSGSVYVFQEIGPSTPQSVGGEVKPADRMAILTLGSGLVLALILASFLGMRMVRKHLAS